VEEDFSEITDAERDGLKLERKETFLRVR